MTVLSPPLIFGLEAGKNINNFLALTSSAIDVHVFQLKTCINVTYLELNIHCGVTDGDAGVEEGPTGSFTFLFHV